MTPRAKLGVARTVSFETVWRLDAVSLPEHAAVGREPDGPAVRAGESGRSPEAGAGADAGE